MVPMVPLDITRYDITVLVAHRYWNRSAVAICSRLVLRRGSVGRKTKIFVIWDLEYQGQLHAKSR